MNFDETVVEKIITISNTKGIKSSSKHKKKERNKKSNKKQDKKKNVDDLWADHDKDVIEKEKRAYLQLSQINKGLDYNAPLFSLFIATLFPWNKV